MSRILLIDDEKDLTALWKDSLVSRGHEVSVAHDGEEGVRLADSNPELIVLDIMMPGLDGYEVCRRIRDTVICPVIFLSAKGTETDRLKGLAMGGDDYLVKPFSLKELLARIEAHLRREKRAQLPGHAPGGAALKFSGLAIDLKSREAAVAGRLLSLTRREFDILELLAMHPGQVFSKEQIYERIWGYDAEGDAGTVSEHVKNLRSKLSQADLGRAAGTDYISTVWGIGYRFNRVR